jgi:FtsP/CotA-like multicopper oxidase with cupredoxin domain
MNRKFVATIVAGTRIGLAATLSTVTLASCARLPEVQANDNRTPAGTLRGDTLVVRLVVQPARWHPEAPEGPYIDTEALGEEGAAPSVPAPLLRVRTGTVISATVRNALRDSTVWVHGLYTRPAEHDDSVAVPPGESRSVTFETGSPGTYVYGVNVGNVDADIREREQITGALVVDSANGSVNDRVFVMNIWGEPVDSTRYSNILAINGKSFPYSETIEATTGDTVRWRWVNGTIRPHPMHLHGFYFTISSRGHVLRDTAYDAPRQRTVVTEVMEPFTTMAMSWAPDRDGHWLFHCHIAFHAIADGARLDPPEDHAMMSGDPGEHMAGLVLGINVKAASGWTPAPRENARTLRLFVQEGPKLGRSVRTLGYSVEYGTEEPPASLTRVGGPPLILTRGQPTDITVINRLKEYTAVHWHGLELESYSDGVVGWSGHPGQVAPRITPADSFTARLTMPRAGTFIYHTHLNDVEQLTSGLYGAIIVREPREPFDPANDHLFLASWDGPEDPAHLLVNGDSTLAPMTWRVGSRHRLRFINIGAAGLIRAVLAAGADTSIWRAVAKDGADLPLSQTGERPATAVLDVGETADFEFVPPRRGDYTLTIHRSLKRPPVVQRITVR